MRCHASQQGMSGFKCCMADTTVASTQQSYFELLRLQLERVGVQHPPLSWNGAQGAAVDAAAGAAQPSSGSAEIACRCRLPMLGQAVGQRTRQGMQRHHLYAAAVLAGLLAEQRSQSPLPAEHRPVTQLGGVAGRCWCCGLKPAQQPRLVVMLRCFSATAARLLPLPQVAHAAQGCQCRSCQQGHHANGSSTQAAAACRPGGAI